MEGRPRKVVIYGTVREVEPYTEWLAGLREAKGKIGARILRIEETGNFGDWAAVGDGVLN